jgi:LuxR family maltose regulon positive regulatory protein
VGRPAVVSRLVRCEAPLVLIVAPPGYGKTSLIAEWEQWDERPFVWLAPGTADGGELPDLIGTRRGRRPRVVVLDRAERLAPEGLAELAERLLDELAPGSTLVVCSRREPELPEGRLRAHRILFEVRRRELALSALQAAELLRLSGLEVDPGVAAALVRETDGWPAALYLAALSMRERREQQDGAGRFLGDDHLLAEYVRDEILSALTADEARWLSLCSVADELTGPLCQALTGRPGSARMLPELARLTQLLEPADAAGSRYRWHRLFRDCMRGELRRCEAPGLEQELHRRASAWHEQQGSADAAIEQACRAGDPGRVGRLLSATIASYAAGGQAQHVLDWLSCFSREQIASSPALAMCAAHGCLAKGSVIEAHHWAAAARASLEDRQASPATSDVETGIAVVEAATARSGASGIHEAAERARALDRGPGQWRPAYLHLLGVSAHLLGDQIEASRHLERAVDLADSVAPCTAALALSQQAIIAIEREDWEQAEELGNRASRVLADSGLDRYPLAALPYAVCAAVNAHQGYIDQAKSDLRRGLELHAFLGDFVAWYAAQASILLAHAALWLADVAGARALLAQASRFSRKLGDAVVFERWFTDAWAYMDTLAESRLNGPSSLTIAELRVLRFLPSHRSFREIAAQLGVSSNTVKSQAHAVYRKLGANSRSEAVARASDAGLLG